jgi:hypothetical protein
VAAQEATKAIALAARPEAERLVLATKLARKREETAGISPVVCGVASVVRVCEDSVAEGCPLNALPPRLTRTIGGKEQMIG